MAGLPSVQKAKLETMKATQTEVPVVTTIKPATPTAVVSLTPIPEVKPSGEVKPIDPNLYAVTPTTTETPTTVTPTPNAEVTPETSTDWQAEAKDLKQKWKSVSGMYERAKADKKDLEDKIESLTNTVSELSKKLEVKPAPKAPDPDEVITPEEETQYKDAFPVVRKLSKSVAREVLEQVVNPLKQEIADLKNQTATVSKNTAETDERVFYNNVRDRVKTMDTIIQDPKWQEYLNGRVPYTNNTVGQALVAAHNGRDMDRVVEIFEGFNKGAASNGNPLESMVTPTITPSGQPSSLPQPKPILKWSERQKASEDFRKGRMDRTKFDQITALYKEAEKDNRIDYKA